MLVQKNTEICLFENTAITLIKITIHFVSRIHLLLRSFSVLKLFEKLAELRTHPVFIENKCKYDINICKCTKQTPSTAYQSYTALYLKIQSTLNITTLSRLRNGVSQKSLDRASL